MAATKPLSRWPLHLPLAGTRWLERNGVKVLAAGKLGKAALLAAIGFGSLRLINRDTAEIASQWAHLLRVDPENHYVRLLLVQLGTVSPDKLRHFGFWTLLFSLDQVVEGIGLWFNQSWAKYLMLVATAVFLADRCYLLTRHFSVGQLPVLAVTLFLLLFIIWILRHDRARVVPETGSE